MSKDLNLLNFLSVSNYSVKNRMCYRIRHKDIVIKALLCIY